MSENIEILPLEIVTRTFPTRPAALPDVRDFVRRHLTDRQITDDDVRVLGERVAGVLLAGAGAAGAIQVSLRIFPDSAEVDVLFVPLERKKPPPTVPAPDPPPSQTFAAWLTDRLRADGLTIEAAARRLDVSTKTISRWMSGTTEPRLRDLYRIRDSFGEPPFH
ncbi:helix-turn-helix domain-containing protein [Paractinoplanes hotanensis]|uniref:Helix-turn-helix domain-containing protein n=1 Tax=Paractinoplanes hotanensis TaxID=2906497 RepID=A0ABT0Y4J9_9ACTN|nr:helix-turn-helix transcriptional regulator [Actinoplanes hotanensis]MCM4080961.1 helix-turn-helix domain-containing protein [Actinoplanes hotanensis]